MSRKVQECAAHVNEVAATGYDGVMRVLTLNVNGIRSAARRGLFPWLATQQADVICLQEVRADRSLLDNEAFALPGYQHWNYPAERKGYAGVALYSRLPVKR